MLKSISVSQPISRVFWLAFDLQQCKMIYVQFYYIDCTYELIFHLQEVLCKPFFRQMFKHGSLVKNDK